MKKLFLVTAMLALAMVFGSATIAPAYFLSIYADVAPNGGSTYDAWAAAAFAAAANGNFQTMQHGAFPGEKKFAATDAITYATGDHGKRVHWVYWIPMVTVESFQGRLRVKDVFDWDGVDRTYDPSTGNLVADTPDVGWSQPGTWVDYTNDQGVSGIVGTFGNAWWADDDLAFPLDETDAADVAEQAAQMYQYQTHWTGLVQFGDGNGNWYQPTEVDLTLSNPAVPEPMSIILGIMGLGSIAGFRRFRK